ncbi:Caspase-8 [Willisornis vidua]|uniref:Caspase-8 n=1 Tax=Willisornis vidua TaxID=1566151 RepID=A0ABQ9CRX1_9PASS|nr:Caspase-8 [Willisornis vidua]
MELPRGALLEISEELGKAELAALKFLSREHVPRARLESAGSPHELFEALWECGALEAGNMGLLRELLYRIGRIDLLAAHLGSGREQVERELREPRPGQARVAPYRAREGVLQLRCLKDRNGTDVDAAALRNVFSKLHFRVEEYRDLTAEEIRKTVNIFRCEDHEDKDCFVCCILSHGKKGIIYGVDGQEVPIRELTTSFTAQNCHSLAGKPKVFFIQACQGDALQKAVTIEADAGEQDASAEGDRRFQQECIPAEADFLLGMATLQDYVSYRSPREGTWYIQALCQHLESRCPRYLFP